MRIGILLRWTELWRMQVSSVVAHDVLVEYMPLAAGQQAARGLTLDCVTHFAYTNDSVSCV